VISALTRLVIIYVDTEKDASSQITQYRRNPNVIGKQCHP